MKKILAMLLALSMVLALVACGGKEETPEPNEDTPGEEITVAEYEPSAPQMLVGKEYGTDYTALYEQFGDDITIDDVQEDAATGLAYIEVDGETYELGLDFLSMAMVYKTEIPEGSSFATSDEIYAEWWKYYITRWNCLLPEIPLYSNEYYDVYNAKIKGVDTYPTNPYWSTAYALIDWTSEKDDNSFIIGNTTDLSGKFRYATFGGTSPGAADNDISKMITGLETCVVTKDGGYAINPTVVKNLEQVINEDGSKTFTIEIYDDMKYSDGSPVTAKDYLAFTLAFSTPVATAAAGKDHRAGMKIVGYETFSTYTGEEGTGTKELSGLRLLGDYKFSVTIQASYIPYFYDVTYAAFAPEYLELWLGDADIKDDGNGCYLTEEFYEKDGDKFVMADHIVASARNTDTTYPYSGAYTVVSYDDSDKSATLKLNPYFKGNYEGATPSIETIVYKKIISETQLEDFKSGGVDCLAGITGGEPTNEAIALADGSNGAYVYTHYSRAGYGKLAFRNDYGPAQFTEVRQAVAYCMDRAKFAKDFTGGYGGVVDGPYYTGSWMYKAATAQGMQLNAYSTSADSAIAVLEEAGWNFDKDGNEYVSGVRYKRIPAEYATENDINYKSKDGAYVTTKVGDFYYMPLVLNWYGTVDNDFSDLLVTGFMNADNIAAAGIVVQNTTGDFAPMLDELYQQAVYGYYAGTPMYTNFNFATGFTSSIYDYSYNLTIDPAMYNDYSLYYINDMADIYWLK